MLRLDHVLVQQKMDGNSLSFAFRGKRWSMYAFMIAMVLFVGTVIISDIDNMRYKEFLVPGGYLFSCLFIWSSIYSYLTKIELDIVDSEGIVKYRSSSPFGTKEWVKDFNEFIEIRIWRPERSSFLKVVLRMKDKQEIPLGTSETGIFSLEQARKISGNLATVMNIPVIEEPTVSWEF